MSFIAGTEIFTDTGWKKIEDIAGRDKVLVRNFVGDAEFTQPFALHKKKYSGDVLVLGRKKWGVTVTPDHMVEYVIATNGLYNSKAERKRADSIKPNVKNRITRGFKYLEDDMSPVKLRLRGADHQFKIISIEDWVTLLAYMLLTGSITKRYGKLNLYFRVPEGPHLNDLCMILDRNSISWSYNNGRVYPSRKNNLASKFINTLGAMKRSDMFLPDDIIFGLPAVHRKIFMQRFITLGMVKFAKENRWMFSTTNKRLVDNMIIFSYLSGYSANYRVLVKSGDPIFDSVAKRDSYQLLVQNMKNSVTIPEPIRQSYDGFVYSIDIFDGSVYIKNRTPIWLPPR